MDAVLGSFQQTAQSSILQVLDGGPYVEGALFPSPLLAALLIGLCRGSLAQGDADLEAPGLAPFPATLARGATLFQSVRIRWITARKKTPRKAAEIGTPGIVPGFLAHPKRRRYR